MSIDRPISDTKEIFENPEDLTGFSPGISPNDPLPEGRLKRTARMAWISDELLDWTQRLWSKNYGRPVGVEEAVEILTNVKHLALALAKAKRGGDED